MLVVFLFGVLVVFACSPHFVRTAMGGGFWERGGWGWEGTRRFAGRALDGEGSFWGLKKDKHRKNLTVVLTLFGAVWG